MAVGNNNDIEKRLWDAADQLRANSRLKSSEYSVPVLGLLFLRYADYKFSAAQKEMEASLQAKGRRVSKSKAELMTLVLEGCMFKDGILQREKMPELAGARS
jgi:type I restriction-modification system DNA methylase subunit